MYKDEYHFTKKFWVVFLVVGIISIGLAFSTDSLLVSSVLSVFGFANMWGIGEVLEQEKRVAKGWFPKKKI